MVPWLAAPGDPDTCNGRIVLSEETLAKYLTNMNQLFKKIIFYNVIDQTDSCLKPCLEHIFYVKQKDADKGHDHRKIVLNFHKVVKVSKNVKAYGLFDLVVEVGSCLGLWIGLSALGVFDLVLEFGKHMKGQI